MENASLNPLKKMGQTIAVARKAHGFSQAIFAEECGLNLRHYQNIEAGRVNVRLHTLLNIAQSLDLSPCQLLESDDVKFSEEYRQPIFSRLIDDLSLIVVVTDISGLVKYVNAAYERHSGNSVESVVGKKHVWDLAADNVVKDRFRTRFLNVIKHQLHSIAFGIELESSRNQSSPVLIRFHRIRKEGEQLKGFLFGMMPTSHISPQQLLV